MSAKKTDISQIRKYLNGQLDARAMHQLESEAQDDPFLMDAVEGYDAAGSKDKHANLHELQQRLHDRINQQSKKRIILWQVISIAASVLVFMGIGLWFYVNHSSAPSAIISKSDRTVAIEKQASPISKTPPITADNQFELKPATSKPANNNLSIVHHRVKKHIIPIEAASVKSTPAIAMAPKVSPADSVAKDNMLKEVIVTGYATQKRRDIAGSVASSVQSMPMALEGRVAGVSLNSKSKKSKDSLRTITGQVISADDKQPIIGATVTVLGKNQGVVTDVNGRFKIEVAKKDNIKVAFIGYNPQQLMAKGDVFTIALNPDQRSLSEVVIGYGVSKDEIKKAHPRDGWDSFKKYLDNAISPDGKTGKVRLRFVVNADNTLTDFKVIKSLSPDADAKAIRLIKEGPGWIHHVNGETETVTVTIKFK